MKDSRYSLKIWSKGGLPGKCRNRDTVWIVESRAAARNALCNAPSRQGRDYGLAALLQSLQDAFDIGLAQPDGFREENASHSQKIWPNGKTRRKIVQPRGTLIADKVIRQNLVFAFIYNAAAAMALSSVSGIGNALRLSALKLE